LVSIMVMFPSKHLCIVPSSSSLMNEGSNIPLEFAQASAPMSTDPPIDVCMSLTFSHSLSLWAFFSGTAFGTMKKRSVASE